MDRIESDSRAESVSELLTQLGMTDAAISRWWDSPNPALDNRTPRRVWRHNHLVVEHVVASIAEDAESLDTRGRRALGAPVALGRTA
jgi:hypothetical protein